MEGAGRSICWICLLKEGGKEIFQSATFYICMAACMSEQKAFCMRELTGSY
jgi:hypothetical protein